MRPPAGHDRARSTAGPRLFPGRDCGTRHHAVATAHGRPSGSGVSPGLTLRRRRPVLGRPATSQGAPERDRLTTDTETGVAPGVDPRPQYAFKISMFNVSLQFTLIHAAGCALHRHTSRVIHRLESISLSHPPEVVRRMFHNTSLRYKLAVFAAARTTAANISVTMSTAPRERGGTAVDRSACETQPCCRASPRSGEATGWGERNITNRPTRRGKVLGDREQFR